MPVQEKPVNHFLIRVDGELVPTQLMDDLIDVVVDSNLHLPDLFMIRVHDESLEWIDRGPFSLGASVEIGVVPQDGGEEQELIKGEITALEPDFAEGTHAALTVRGYDRAHRLHRGTHSRAFTQVTDSDLASRIAQEVGLRADVESTSQVYEHVIQYNQTHMAFLRSRARRIGYEVYVRDRTLHFKKPNNQPSGTPLELEWGDQLKTFRPRLTLIEQVDEVTVKGWDAKNKAEIMGSANRSTATPEIGEPQSGTEAASEAFGAGQRIVVNWPVSSQAEADAVAQSLYDEICGSFIEAEGRCTGQPALKAGMMVQLNALGDKLSGKYFVTSATHIYSAQGEYITEFKVHGRRPDTLRRLLVDESGETPGNVVTAIVTNNKDDDDQGRVKLKYPWLSDDVESGWARVLGTGAGDERGFYCLPEVNDEVLVTFEHGDINRPLVIGSLWNGVDKPAVSIQEAVKDGKVHTRAFKTRQGHALTFVDDSGALVRLETASGHALLLDDENTLVELKTQGGITLTLNDQDGSVTLNCQGNLKIEAQQAITIQAGSNLEISANGNVAIKGTKIDLN